MHKVPLCGLVGDHAQELGGGRIDGFHDRTKRPVALTLDTAVHLAQALEQSRGKRLLTPNDRSSGLLVGQLAGLRQQVLSLALRCLVNAG